MYRGINGTPPSRAPSCTNPTPLNYHRPPPLRPSRSALSLSPPHPLPLFLPSRLPPLPSLTATPSNPLPSFQLHPSLSLYYMYARMYICTSFCLAPLAPRPSPTAPARRLTTLTPLRPPSYSPAQHTSQIGSRATLYPVPVCTAAG